MDIEGGVEPRLSHLVSIIIPHKTFSHLLRALSEETYLR